MDAASKALELRRVEASAKLVISTYDAFVPAAAAMDFLYAICFCSVNSDCDTSRFTTSATNSDWTQSSYNGSKGKYALIPKERDLESHSLGSYSTF